MLKKFRINRKTAGRDVTESGYHSPVSLSAARAGRNADKPPELVGLWGPPDQFWRFLAAIGWGTAVILNPQSSARDGLSGL
ncbi:Odorant receptor 13a [Culex quinquefasciatus]|uniref:Odorant receptor 13a n=1 Tax=Culex quinquefasciatus TaxID=7176 RepID=B0WAZ9_CULQU|nr:Odorant receptor 13a [Culex quinquefasciatus]|eukprot:XP_001845883.1 Odorant receptor 13a [Culex quinquefasciatus]